MELLKEVTKNRVRYVWSGEGFIYGFSVQSCSVLSAHLQVLLRNPHEFGFSPEV